MSGGDGCPVYADEEKRPKGMWWFLTGLLAFGGVATWWWMRRHPE